MKNQDHDCDCCPELTQEEGNKRREFLNAIGAGLASMTIPTLMTNRAANAASGFKIVAFGALMGSAAHNAAIEVARAKRFVEDQGLQLEMREYASGANLIQAIASGEVASGVCGVNPALLGKAQGVDLKILANANLEGSVLIVGPHVRSTYDLNGRKIGTPGIAAIQDALLSVYEEKNGIKVEHVFVKVSDMPTLLRNGEIDGYIVWEATGQAGLERSGGRIISTSKNIRSDHECCALIANSKFLKSEQDTALRLVKAYAQGLKYAIANREELISIIAAKDMLEKSVAQKALANVKYKYPPINNPGEIMFATSALIKAGKIERSQISDIEKFVSDVVDNRLIRSVIT